MYIYYTYASRFVPRMTPKKTTLNMIYKSWGNQWVGYGFRQIHPCLESGDVLKAKSPTE